MGEFKVLKLQVKEIRMLEPDEVDLLNIVELRRELRHALQQRMGGTMTPSEQAKAAGLKSLAELAQISNTSTRTLINWHRHNITRFTVLLAGAVVIKAANVKLSGAASSPGWADFSTRRQMMITVIDLGWCIARLNTDKNLMTIVSPAHASEHTYQPAESVVVWGVDALGRLREALNEAYPVTPNV